MPETRRRKKQDVGARFWQYVERTETCWIWTGARLQSGGGYGAFQVDGVVQRAHRFAYELTHGPIPPGLQALHEYDNPPCVRPGPGHVYLGTPADNTRDMMQRGQHRHGWDGPISPAMGEAAAHVTLTEREVLAIRGLLERGLTRREIATQYGVSHFCIQSIAIRRTWKHL